MIAENDRPYNAFLRLAVHMCDLRQTLNECSNVVAEPAAWDLSYVADQVAEQIDTLEIMTRDAEKYWHEIQHDIAKAAGSLNLDRPADNVSWCHSIIHASWQTWKRLSRQCQQDPADRVRVFAKLADSLREFDDRDTWEKRIAKEFRALVAIAGEPTSEPTYTDDAIPKGLLCSQLGIKDDEFQKRITECPSLIHPSHGKRDRNVRFDVDALINTELYTPSLRAAAILKWRSKSTSKR